MLSVLKAIQKLCDWCVRSTVGPGTCNGSELHPAVVRKPRLKAKLHADRFCAMNKMPKGPSGVIRNTRRLRHKFIWVEFADRPSN